MKRSQLAQHLKIDCAMRVIECNFCLMQVQVVLLQVCTYPFVCVFVCVCERACVSVCLCMHVCQCVPASLCVCERACVSVHTCL